MDDNVVESIRDLYRYFRDDDYDDDMIWWDYLYVYAMITFVVSQAFVCVSWWHLYVLKIII